jgi:hypothetical protein
MRWRPRTRSPSWSQRSARSESSCPRPARSWCRRTTTTRPASRTARGDDDVARDALVSGLVTDALAIIDALSVVGLDDEAERAVALLALVAGQDVEPGEAPGSWRIARAVAKDRIVFTVDPESRHAHKSRSSYRDGYKGISRPSRRAG